MICQRLMELKQQSSSIEQQYNQAIILDRNWRFTKKQRFKLKKIENLIYVRNMNRTFNKKEPIENIVKVNIYYQGHKERMRIDVIRRQKQNMILKMLWLAQLNLEIDWRIGKVKIT